MSNSILYLIKNVFSEPAFLIGMVAIIGLAVQKKKAGAITSSAIKTMVGFLMITTGAQSMGMALLPLQPMLIKVFNLNVKIPEIGNAIGASFTEIGVETTLIFAIGFMVNVLIARFTKFKYVHLSAHVSFFYAGLIAALLKFNTSLNLALIVIIGSILLGIYLTFTCAYIAPLMKHIKGGQGFTIGHSSSIGCLISAGLGKVFGNKDKDLEAIKLPKGFEFLRETTISLTVVMSLIFLIISLISGPSFVVSNVSNGRDIITFSLLSGLNFGLWITVIITGVRMMLAEIVPAFHGISNKLIPNAIPGLDVPLLFPNHPTSVLVGFICSLLAGFVGMTILGLLKYPIIVFPALIPTFFTGAVTAIFGNATGGRRGAIIGSFVNGLILIFGQALLLPLVGSYEPVMRVLSETDYTFYGPLLGRLLRLLGI
ncbi:PTS system, ascorbate-specific IIC component [Clostridium amylolyticum]|uniref:Ascorbate-specific PTS system EIIC component n=1 Tax=Clostridium amylolyticum TaxID=1121298 RepID=A0A1M6GK74_9CLOT|nr:PTS ascorbate transporter subunit IIC [Clostridium amylolyticum]SHJ10320.1 PTS system, ascorbate-specific IIC component [Clostridium amylolyticum]